MFEFWVIDLTMDAEVEIPMWGYSFADACRRKNREQKDFYIVSMEYID